MDKFLTILEERLKQMSMEDIQAFKTLCETLYGKQEEMLNKKYKRLFDTIQNEIISREQNKEKEVIQE